MGIEKIWLEVYGQPINIFGYPQSFVFDQTNKLLSVDFPYLFESEDTFNVEALYRIVLGLNYLVKKDFEISQVLNASLSNKPVSISNYIKKKSTLVEDQDNRAWVVDNSGKFQHGLVISKKITGQNQIVLDYDEQVISDYSSDLTKKNIKVRSKVRYHQWLEEIPDKSPMTVIVRVIASDNNRNRIESYQGIVKPVDRSRILDPIQTLQLKNVELISKIDL